MMLDSFSPPRAVPHGIRIGATLAVLVAAWLVLSVTPERSADGPSSDECLTLADVPPTTDAPTLRLMIDCAVLLPDDVELLADLGATYEQAGDAANAEAVYARALARDPDYGDLHVRMAKLLRARGALVDARGHAEAALRLQPNRRLVLDLLADLNGQSAAAHDTSSRPLSGPVDQ